MQFLHWPSAITPGVTHIHSIEICFAKIYNKLLVWLQHYRYCHHMTYLVRPPFHIVHLLLLVEERLVRQPVQFLHSRPLFKVRKSSYHKEYDRLLYQFKAFTTIITTWVLRCVEYNSSKITSQLKLIWFVFFPSRQTQINFFVTNIGDKHSLYCHSFYMQENGRRGSKFSF